MTDPTGCVFISYRRSPARPTGNREAVLLREALRHVGVPTWRDLEDLEHEPTEEALVTAIKDPSLSGAILLISPEVATSPTVRRVEALRIFRRYAARDGFWVLPVLIGVGYAEADSILDSPAGFQNLGHWNMHRVAGDTLTWLEAQAIARCAVKARVRAIRDIQSERPLSVGVFARRPPSAPCSLTHDFSGQFKGRKVAEGSYETFEKALLASASRILATFPSPHLVGQGMAPLPLGALLGAVYSPRAGFKLDWSQFVEGQDRQHWSFDVPGSELPMDFRVTMGDPSSEDLVMAIGLSANIEHAVVECLDHLGVERRAPGPLRARVGIVHARTGSLPEQGVGFVLSTIQRVRELREDLGMRRSNLHLFLACPLGMAVLVGQRLNTFSTCHLYEHDPDTRPSYIPVHTFQPSSLVFD